MYHHLPLLPLGASPRPQTSRRACSARSTTNTPPRSPTRAPCACTLLRLQREIEREAAAIAGADYKESYDVGYDAYGSMESQRAVDDGAIVGPGLIDVVELAASIATYAGRVSASATPPQMPSE